MPRNIIVCSLSLLLFVGIANCGGVEESVEQDTLAMRTSSTLGSASLTMGAISTAEAKGCCEGAGCTWFPARLGQPAFCSPTCTIKKDKRKVYSDCMAREDDDDNDDVGFTDGSGNLIKVPVGF